MSRTILTQMRELFGEFDEETKCKRSGSWCEGETVVDEYEFSQGPRRPNIVIQIRRHRSST